MFRRVAIFRLPSQLRSIRTSTQCLTELKLTFASSAQAFYNNVAVKQVDVPTLNGRFGVLAEHVPTVGCLKPGIVAVTENDGSVKKYFGYDCLLVVRAAPHEKYRLLGVVIHLNCTTNDQHNVS
ncbi:unnamed protein product [Schistosoma curassoni]|uniref:ATP synthase F1 complex delta/epsilon subunit N-terminal domain-containing protein n=1 Tax=Schistosoma curassoni TaxID=6186 RepID=A0A3P8DJN9_9TREM|nr:unnamed protein product [Schistosoma curassoni]